MINTTRKGTPNRIQQKQERTDPHLQGLQILELSGYIISRLKHDHVVIINKDKLEDVSRNGNELIYLGGKNKT